MEDLVLSIPAQDAAFIETLASRMGWTMRRRRTSVERFVSSCKNNSQMTDEEIQAEINAYRKGLWKYCSTQTSGFRSWLASGSHLLQMCCAAKSDIRDRKDLYLLSMAESVPVDYIVSGDRDLTDMKQHAGIPILKYTELIDLLNKNKG